MPQARVIEASGLDAPNPRIYVNPSGKFTVGGTEEAPLNLWRIVHLTDGQDPQLAEVFSKMSQSRWLPEFIEIYIRRDLHIDLTRRPLHPRAAHDRRRKAIRSS